MVLVTSNHDRGPILFPLTVALLVLGLVATRGSSFAYSRLRRRPGFLPSEPQRGKSIEATH